MLSCTTGRSIFLLSKKQTVGLLAEKGEGGGGEESEEEEDLVQEDENDFFSRMK